MQSASKQDSRKDQIYTRVNVSSMSPALLRLVFVPPREERLDAWTTDRVCDVNLKFNLCIATGHQLCQTHMIYR